jgi:hypothetical protein
VVLVVEQLLQLFLSQVEQAEQKIEATGAARVVLDPGAAS